MSIEHYQVKLNSKECAVSALSIKSSPSVYLSFTNRKEIICQNFFLKAASCGSLKIQFLKRQCAGLSGSKLTKIGNQVFFPNRKLLSPINQFIFVKKDIPHHTNGKTYCICILYIMLKLILTSWWRGVKREEVCGDPTSRSHTSYSPSHIFTFYSKSFRTINVTK